MVSLAVPVKPGHPQFVDALGIDKCALLLIHQRRDGIADVAQIVLGGPEQLPPQTRIDSQVRSSLVVILEEQSVIVDAIFMVGNAAAAERKSGLPQKEILKITASVNAGTGRIERVSRGRKEEQLSVKRLRKVLVQGHAIVLPAKAKQMFPGGIAGRVQEREIVLQLALVGPGRGTQIKRGKSKFINRFVEIAVRPVDPQVIDSHNRLVNRFVVDADVANSRFVHQARTEDMSLGHAQEAIVHRQVKGKVHVRDVESAAQSCGQATGAEWQLGLEIGKEEASGYVVRATMKVAVIVGRELVVGILPGLAEHKLTASRGIGVGEQESARIVELAVAEVQKLESHGIDRRRSYVSVPREK